LATLPLRRKVPQRIDLLDIGSAPQQQVRDLLLFLKSNSGSRKRKQGRTASGNEEDD
jgi:hypothetical protein